jgi:hypothetical protein
VLRTFVGSTLTCAAILGVGAACASDAAGPRAEGDHGYTHLAACGATTQPFTVSPVALSDVIGWMPLGNLNPTGHLFPTDHQYIYVNHPQQQSTQRPVNVYAPGTITITGAHRTNYSGTNTNDYAIDFGVCDEIRGEFGHVTSVEPALLQALGAFDQQCNSYSLAGSTAVFANCYTKPLAVVVPAGTLIGTAGNAPPTTSFALDFSLWDARITPNLFANPSRWTANELHTDRFHVVAPSEYFVEPLRTAIRARVGSFDGTRIRTAEPRGGTVAVDVAGTLQGVWFNNAQPTFPEGVHLAVAPDPIDPSRIGISMGLSQPFTFAGLAMIDPVSSGRINRHPADVKADGSIYCYDTPSLRVSLLVKLEDATTVRVEGVPGTKTCAQLEPFAFGSTSFVYRR